MWLSKNTGWKINEVVTRDKLTTCGNNWGAVYFT